MKHSIGMWSACGLALAAAAGASAGTYTAVTDATDISRTFRNIGVFSGGAGNAQTTAFEASLNTSGGALTTGYGVTGSRFGGGSATLYRVFDQTNAGSAGSDVDLSGSQFSGGGFGSGVTDQVWTDGISSVAVKAVFAGFNQRFGFSDASPTIDASGQLDNYTNILDATGGGTANVNYQLDAAFSDGVFAAGSDVGADVTGDPPRWTWSRSSGGATPGTDPDGSDMSSLESINLDVSDHMITFFLDADGDGKASAGDSWFLFFEDLLVGNDPLNEGNIYDGDFSDLVIEMTIIPLPASGGVAAAALALGAGFRRRRLT
jgi:hypothetical protein